MHEFSIAINIVEIALETALKNKAERIRSVEVVIGQASGVVPEALEFAWESARKNTMAGEAGLIVRTVGLKARCNGCSHEYEAAEVYGFCPVCGDFSKEIITGKELRIVAIEI